MFRNSDGELNLDSIFFIGFIVLAILNGVYMAGVNAG